MPSFDEELARMLWLQKEKKVDGAERCKLIFPRLEAKRRIKNESKNRRIVMVTDEHNYSEFHAMREAYTLELGENPTLVTQAIIEAMKEFDVRGWKERGNAAGD